MSDIQVYSSGQLNCDGREYVCVLGRGGVSANKKEGDGATPLGQFPVRKVFFRADRIARPTTVIPLQEISESDGWCDDPEDPNYNQLVSLPYPARHEVMWRADHLYDLVLVLGYNDQPPVPYKGSAIFMHVASPDFDPTEGCVALALSDLLEILGTIDLDSNVSIQHERDNG